MPSRFCTTYFNKHPSDHTVIVRDSGWPEVETRIERERKREREREGGREEGKGGLFMRRR
jgi:hypothetical protein